MTRKVFSPIAVFLAIALIALPIDMEAGGLETSRKKRNAVENYFAFTFSGGYSNLMTHDPIAKPNGFIGGLAGVGYEMHKEGFWWSVAGELECMTSSIAIDREVLDDEAHKKDIDANYDVSRWRDCPHYLFLSMPLLLGYKSDVFYIGFGPKMMFCAYGRSRNYINYSIDGEKCDTRASDYPDRNKINLAACLEAGTMLSALSGGGKSKRRRGSRSAGVDLKIGLYAEYGFLNLNAAEGKQSVVTINSHDKTLSVIPLFTSSSMTNRTVNPLYVGVKLTLLYGR